MGFQGNHEEDTDEVSSQADELGEPRTGVEPPISSDGSSDGVFDLGQAASAQVAAEMADEAVAQKFSPEQRAEIKRIFTKGWALGWEANQAQHRKAATRRTAIAKEETSTQPAVSSSKDKGSGFDWTQCKSEVCCPIPCPLLHAVSCDFLPGCVCFHP